MGSPRNPDISDSGRRPPRVCRGSLRYRCAASIHEWNHSEGLKDVQRHWPVSW